MNQKSTTIIHLPTPGDHYSPSTGSAVMTVIYELNRCHEADGNICYVVVGSDTMHDYPAGKCLLAPPNVAPTNSQKVIDLAFSRLGLGRPYARRYSAPLVAQIPHDTTGYVLVHNQPAIIGDIRRQAPGSKIVLYCHNELFALYTDREVRAIARTADYVVCVSEFTAAGFNRRAGSAGAHAVGIINGVNCEMFAPAVSRTSNPVPVILFVARVVPEKGADILLKAAVQLASDGFNFRLRVVGSSNFNASDPPTPYELQLRELAKPIAERVEFVPFRNRQEIVEEYRAADIFCAPSNWDEPCSLTVSEAMASGLPCVISRRGGMPEVGASAALYFQPPDHRELAGQLGKLLNSEELRNKHRELGLSRAREISWSAQYAKLRNVLCF
jgi:glycosyltransferase involved in cell wall biosynthesis